MTAKTRAKLRQAALVGRVPFAGTIPDWSKLAPPKPAPKLPRPERRLRIGKPPIPLPQVASPAVAGGLLVRVLAPAAVKDQVEFEQKPAPAATRETARSQLIKARHRAAKRRS